MALSIRRTRPASNIGKAADSFPMWCVRRTARSCREYFFVTYSGKAYSVDPGEKCNRYKRVLASSVPKLPQLRPVIVRWSTLFRPRFAA